MFDGPRASGTHASVGDIDRATNWRAGNCRAPDRFSANARHRTRWHQPANSRSRLQRQDRQDLQEIQAIITASVPRFHHQFNADEVFGTHNAPDSRAIQTASRVFARPSRVDCITNTFDRQSGSVPQNAASCPPSGFFERGQSAATTLLLIFYKRFSRFEGCPICTAGRV